MTDFINKINGIVWSEALIILCIGAGIYFSIATKFLQITNFRDMLRLLFAKATNDSGVSSFQAFSVALCGRIGTGNIVGVATAIAMGGPGAVFWMWVIAILGSATAYIEATLGQIYKEKKDSEYRGGPAYYIEKGMGVKWYAMLFALVTIVSTGLLLPGVQSNSISSGMRTAFEIPTHYTAIALVVLTLLIISGGIKRISKFSEIIIPIMSGGYILLALIIIGMNIGQVPEMFSLIIRSAFGMEEAFGGIIGAAIAWGVKRGIYSNEAGQGTAPHAAAAAAVTHPAKQGLVQAFSIYVDTLLVCTATAFIILITGQYNVTPADSEALITHIPGVNYTAFTQYAIAHHFPAMGSAFVAIALFCFAFTTIIAYYYMAETNFAYLDKKNQYFKYGKWVIALMVLASTYYGAVKTADVAWTLGDIGVGSMAWLNLIAILILHKPALKALRDYRAQKKQGKDPDFNPTELGIKNAEFWNEEENQNK
ncbi:alanine/glycine:cation symporter family protein [Moheibacter stercoris]|uniref:AGCS family alanine or glycine:cation symporter n=1 Tax=Moheibacter stercoris TaxID=1628251 RepID=A0ABV2LTY7_9FLAO